MLHLPRVTLCAVACTKVDQTIHALRVSKKKIQFADAILLTHEKLDLSRYGIRVINIERLDYRGYNHFVLFRLAEYVPTDFALLVQNDGYVLRPDKWTDDFLEYDYIGAPWPRNLHYTAEGVNIRVGNGGFTLRSKKLLNALNALNLPFTDNGTGYFHEDGVITNYHRKKLEDYGIKYAPVEIASRFSRETMCEDSEKYPFGFHNNKNVPRFLSLRPFLQKLHVEI